MSCGCQGNKNKNNNTNKVPPKAVIPRISGAPIAPPSVPNQAMVNLPPPVQMDAAAARRLKQLNKDAVRRLTGR